MTRTKTQSGFGGAVSQYDIPSTYSFYNKANLLRAKKIALAIEHDLESGAFDSTLNQYKLFVTERAGLQPPKKSVRDTPAKETSRMVKSGEPDTPTSIF